MKLHNLLDGCILGGALLEVGESMRRLAEVKDSLDIDVKQNFIDPFQTLVDKDLKDIQVQSWADSLYLVDFWLSYVGLFGDKP